MKHRIIFLLTTLVLCLSNIATGQNLSSYDGKDPQKLLLDNLLYSTSTTEKVIVRSYLQGKYPLTAEGMFAKAWLAGYEDRDADEVRLYRECVAKYPDSLPCPRNLMTALTGKDTIQERIAIAEKILAKDASFADYVAIRFMYFNIYDIELKDKKSADEFLAKWERKLPDAYIFDFLRGLYAEGTRDFRQAEQFYLRAIEKGTKDFEVYSSLTDLRLRELSNSETSSAVRVGYLEIVKDYALENPSSDAPLIYLGDVATNIFKSDSAALSFYQKAFQTKPTAETAIKIYDLMRKIDWEGGSKEPWAFLVRANEILPSNQKILNTLGYRAVDVKLSEQYFQEAILNSYTLKDEAINARAMGEELYTDRTFEYEKAEKLYRTYLSKGAEKGILGSLYNTLRNAGKFRAAQIALSEFESYLRAQNRINEVYFIEQHRELERYIEREEKSAAYYRDNPFLQYWQTTYGKSYKLTINFPAGSDQIPAGETDKIAQLARIITEKGADSYIFSIEGHTDNTGSEAANKVLSLRRAEAIVGQLNRLHKIPLERLKAKGFGSENSLGPNDVESVRIRNRRIEILPVASINKQTLITTAALNAGRIAAVSPDGKYLAVGNSPIQIWDTELKIKVKDLGAGGTRKFSPNGRYLAAIYDEALIIYDVRTGQVIAQNPVKNGIAYFDWSPYSDKIVFAADWRIVIYDLEQRKNIKSILVESKNASRGVLWTGDGKYIVSARAIAKKLDLYNSSDLSFARNLTGFDWAHGIAQTANGKYIAAADNTSTLSVWDTATWQLRQQQLPTVGNKLAAHPTKPIFILPSWGGGENQPAVMANMETGQVTRNNMGASTAYYQFSPDGAKIYQVYYDRIEILDSASWNKTDAIQGTAVSPTAGYIDAKNNYYVSFDALGVHLWNTQNGRKIFAFNKSDMNWLVEMRGTEDEFIGITEDKNTKRSQVFLLNTTTRQEKTVLNLDYDVDRVLTTDSYIVFCGKPYVPLHTGSKEGFIEFYDRNSLTLKHKITVPFITDYLEKGLNGSGFQSADINPKTNEIVVSTYWLDGFSTGTKYSKEARIFNFTNGSLVRSIKPNEDVKAVFYSSNYDKTSTYDTVGVHYDGGTYVYNSKTGEYLKKDNFRLGENRIWLADGKTNIIWSINGIYFNNAAGKEIRKLNFDDNLQSVAVDESRNLLVAMLNTNEIVYYNLSDFQKKLNIISMKDNEWIAFSPTGEVTDSSEKGTDKVFLAVGDEVRAVPRRPR